MKKLVVLFLVMVFLLATAMPALASTDQDKACWGQASAVYAQMGEMGEHSSNFPTPRHGLMNLARLLFGDDATMQDLGAFVAAELSLSIDACMD